MGCADASTASSPVRQALRKECTAFETLLMPVRKLFADDARRYSRALCLLLQYAEDVMADTSSLTDSALKRRLFDSERATMLAVLAVVAEADASLVREGTPIQTTIVYSRVVGYAQGLCNQISAHPAALCRASTHAATLPAAPWHALLRTTNHCALCAFGALVQTVCVLHVARPSSQPSLRSTGCSSSPSASLSRRCTSYWPPMHPLPSHSHPIPSHPTSSSRPSQRNFIPSSNPISSCSFLASTSKGPHPISSYRYIILASTSKGVSLALLSDELIRALFATLSTLIGGLVVLLADLNDPFAGVRTPTRLMRARALPPSRPPFALAASSHADRASRAPRQNYRVTDGEAFEAARQQIYASLDELAREDACMRQLHEELARLAVDQPERLASVYVEPAAECETP
jgi:hypothetical protein